MTMIGKPAKLRRPIATVEICIAWKNVHQCAAKSKPMIMKTKLCFRSTQNDWEANRMAAPKLRAAKKVRPHVICKDERAIVFPKSPARPKSRTAQ